MLKWLTKTTEEYRFETLEDVRKFEKQCRENAEANGYQLSKYSITEKAIYEGTGKDKEQVDSYYLVSKTTIINDPKDPDNPVVGVNYDVIDQSMLESNISDTVAENPWD